MLRHASEQSGCSVVHTIPQLCPLDAWPPVIPSILIPCITACLERITRESSLGGQGRERTTGALLPMQPCVVHGAAHGSRVSRECIATAGAPTWPPSLKCRRRRSCPHHNGKQATLRTARWKQSLESCPARRRACSTAAAYLQRNMPQLQGPDSSCVANRAGSTSPDGHVPRKCQGFLVFPTLLGRKTETSVVVRDGPAAATIGAGFHSAVPACGTT
jgi:hypothetical protein